MSKVNSAEPITQFVLDRPALNVSMLERLADIPATTLRHALLGRFALPKKHVKKLTAVLREYGYKDKRK